MAALASKRFSTLSEVTAEEVERLFMHGQSHAELTSDTPVLVILIGSPGVGKTTKAKEIIESMIKHPYDTMYHVSLDDIVERIDPYCTLTMDGYKQIVDMVGGPEIPDKMYGPLANLYSTVIHQNNLNFGLSNGALHMYKKLDNIKHNRKTAKKSSKRHSNISAFVSIKTRLDNALKSGLDNSYHVVYDTTFSDTTNKMDEIINKVHAAEKKHNHIYKVYVIHVIASEEVIRAQLTRRHKAMIEKKCLRAIRPGLIGKYREQNAIGYNLSCDKYKDTKKVQFITVVNDERNKTDVVIGLYKPRIYKPRIYKPRIYKPNNKSNNNKPKTMKRKTLSVNSTIPLSKKPKPKN